MSYRGKKFAEQKHSLEKKNLLQEVAASSVCRGCGSIYRYHKRQYRKKLMEQEEARREEAYRILADAAALREKARIYELWCPDEKQRLEAEADTLQKSAESLLAPVRPAPVHRAPVHRAPAYYSAPVYQPPVCHDPSICALADSLCSGERNFMDGISYRVNPLDTLKMISASSVFGEPQYYRDGENAKATLLNGIYGIDRVFARYSLNELDPFEGMDTAQVMEKAIDEALSADFDATLEWAAELRDRYHMRLNPQVILVRASVHPGREAYTAAHPGKFAETALKVMSRGDDVTNQVQYWLAKHGSKRGIPAILKRSWARRIGAMDAYSMAKYGKTGIGLVDVVRICHAKGELVDILMKEGKVPMPEGQDTWERLRASGMRWKEILGTIRMPHMALLRNLRGIFSETKDPRVREQALELLRRGVRKGKQFPFRYHSAWRAVAETGAPWTRQVQACLEDCMKTACENLPMLKGRSAFLTDNSGSAWGACTSEWGTMQVASIGNLSGVIGAMCSEEGVVFPFGDRLESVTIRKDEGILQQTHRVDALGKQVGMGTENGVWLFFRNAILERQHWDNIFVYSDVQAGHGGLYGIHPEDYAILGAAVDGGMFIDVNRLVEIYRQQVNPKVNVYCIQTAGYTNVLVPEYAYRSAILYGWTGKELLFADAMNRTWDELENRGPEEQ